ncbi:MAG: hypothetical protein H6925_06950 [Holosporaceae bacterium]|nr:MAG: hypothetical protein H6925_06950 [Holosporaceae bacterium]
MANKPGNQQQMSDLDGYDDDGYGDGYDGYDDFEEGDDPQMPPMTGMENAAPKGPPPRQELPQDMGYEAPESTEAPRSGFRVGGTASAGPERLDSGRPPEVMPQAPLPSPVSMQAPIQPTSYETPYKEGEVLARREHPLFSQRLNLVKQTGTRLICIV